MQNLYRIKQAPQLFAETGEKFKRVVSAIERPPTTAF
jgi:hypothetical protein